MSLACIGIMFIQFYWIYWFVDLNEKNFNDKVYTALNEVKSTLAENAEKKESYTGLGDKIQLKDQSISLNKYDPLLKKENKWSKERIIFELNSISKMLNTQELLLELKPTNLSKLIQNSLEDQGINLVYEFGVFNNESNDYFIINENYVVDFGDNEEASDLGMQSNLDRSNYKIQLFSSDYESPGFLSLHFINKRKFVWSSVTPWLLGSIIFTLIILFCFISTIFIIIRQKKISEMKTDFINNMTHEFKTPIATISLASDSINNPVILHKPDKVKRFTGIIKQENQRMLAQVEKVLQMATIEKRDFDLKISKLNIEDLLKQAAENVVLRLEEVGGKIDTEFAFTNPTVELDQTHITSIIHNLFDNAIKYTEGAPHIVLTGKNVRNGVKISIKDNGIGMSKESQKFIFDKFYRVHTGNRHDVKGFGLGLSYVKALVDAHNGKVKVESELGKGSVFTLFFPNKYKPS
jgi:two-component system phosphate regulon sensor histidine kinase PhoR